MNVFIGKTVTFNFMTAQNRAAVPPTYSSVTGECLAIDSFCVVIRLTTGVLALYQWENDTITFFAEVA